MSVIFILLPIALLLGGFFVAAFVVMAKQGQYDDLETPAYRVLLEEDQEDSLLVNFQKNLTMRRK
ncbi:MAG: Cytochrome oxidase maturation protein cbb3-type [Pseudomonadota bacterium]|jgi:cbb3-type cytochrome oxidase maturation protein